MSSENVEQEQRKLAAIMFTDMVGYSALAQQDDKLALELLEEHRRLLRGIFPRFHGTEIKTIGDAFLVEFSSALEAAQCAIEIQRALAKRNTDVSRDRRIELKIGIHIGDVVHRDGDVYGDGVNIASRIEALAGAGGICISTDVERQIRNALEARFEKFGSAELKNIKLPMDLFRIILPWEKGGAGPDVVARPAKKFPGVTVTAILIAIVVLAGWWFLQRSNQEHQRTAASSPNGTAATAPAKATDPKSLAVLPFVNMSDDKGSEYFSDGVSEELLTVLQKIPGLHVAARTSAFSFKGKNATTQEIGQKLGVANLVEGSVRKSGDTVRIAARLSRADTGEEMWSENFTRDLKDVFAVQTELAQTIVEKLRGQLTGDTAGSATKAEIQAEVKAAEKGGTKNVEAHQLYLQGRFFENQNSEKDETKALAAYQRAVQIDPTFALAWAGVGRCYIWYCNFSTAGGLKTFDEHLAAARDATTRALTIEPNLPDALFAQAMIQMNFDSDWKGASETLRKALVLAPQDPAVLGQAGNLAGARGDLPAAIDFLRRAVAADPVNAQIHAYLGGTLSLTGQQEQARKEYARAAELAPTAPYAHAGVALTYLLEGKFEEAATNAQKDSADWARLTLLACARWGQKRTSESDAALAELIKTSADTAAYQVAEIYAYRGEKDKAFEWLERAHRQRDSGLAGIRTDLSFTDLHGDPRWNAFLHEMGLADDQLKG